MGKASKWFRNLLGLKKTDSPAPSPAKQPPPPPPSREKRRWSFVKSHRDRDSSHRHQRYNSCSAHSEDLAADPNKHAIAVAAASAAAAEAAVKAAHAAAEVVRLTSSRRCADGAAAYGGGSCAAIREEVAALKIQSAFRGYLARRALRALKGLVKIQALVRGHIERKRTARLVRKMQALLRAQARARAERAQLSESSQSSSKSSHLHHPGPATPEKSEYVARSKSSRQDQSPVLRRNGSRASGRIVQERVPLGRNWLDCQVAERLGDQRGLSAANGGHADDEKSDKILEIDLGKPSSTPKRRSLVQLSRHALPSDQASHSCTTSKDSTARQMAPSPSSCEVQSLSLLDFSHEVEEGAFCTADNSPQFYSVSSRGGGSSRRSPFTPTKSDGSRSYLSGYSDHPNYMAYTESSKAKVRSMSAPKQRPYFDKSSSTKRHSIHGFGESRSISQKVLSLHANFANKAYPGSGRLDRLGMPVRGDGHGYGY